MAQPITHNSFSATTISSARPEYATSRGRSEANARSVSFSGSSSSSTVVASKSATPVSPIEQRASASSPAPSPRWNAELEERLRWAQRELKEHQKRWSEGQEVFIAEVDRLLELKRQAKKFVRRRSQDHKREGRSLDRAAAAQQAGNKDDESSTGGEEDGVAIDKRLSRILRRTSSGTSSAREDPVEETIPDLAPARAKPSRLQTAPKTSGPVLRLVLRLQRRTCSSPAL